MSTSAIHIKDLSFTHPGQKEPLFSNLSLEVAAGLRFGIFGPNGAGKTTLMSLMTGLLPYTHGSIQLAGQEIKNRSNAVKNRLGFVPQDFSFYDELTPVENLQFFGAWSGLHATAIKKRTEELLHVLDLEDVYNKPVEKFSGGMKRRVNLAIGVIHEPSILILDEPTVGVDVQTRHAIIKYLHGLNAAGTTLIYTSHQLNEAEDLCERVALIDEGRIIAYDALPALLSAHGKDGLEALFLSLTGKKYRNADV